MAKNSKSKAPTQCLNAFTMLFVAGCMSNNVKIISTPQGADVLWSQPGQQAQSLGKTPLTLDDRISPDVFKSDGHIEIQLDGYLPESFVIPKTIVGSSSQYEVTLKQTELPEACRRQSAAANQLARGIAEAQGYIIRKDFAQAESILRQLSETFPQVSVVYDLMGNLYYLQKSVGKALTYYRRSDEIEPNNPRTLRMIEKLAVISGEPGPRNTPTAQGR